MAITFVNESSGVVAAGTVDDVNLPSGLQENDIVVVVLAADSNLTGEGILTSGYVFLFNGSASSPGYQIAYKIMGATPDTVVSIDADAVGNTVAIIQAFRGVDTTTPIDATMQTATGTSASMPDPPSYTTVTDGALRIVTGHIDDDEVTPSSAPSGYSNLLYAFANSGTTSATAMMASKIAATAGAEDPGVFGGTNSDNWVSAHFALRPAAGGTEYDLILNSGSFTETGTDASLKRSRLFATDGTSYTLTGTNVVLNKGSSLSVEGSSYTLTGTDVTLTSSSFNPSQLFDSGELGGWWDPSDLSTLWQDTAGTTAVTADGQSVARMDDKSGNGNHFTQATEANRPIYRTDGTLHWLEFDGTNDRLDTASIDLTSLNQLTILTAVEILDAGTTMFLECSTSTNTSGNVGGFHISLPYSATYEAAVGWRHAGNVYNVEQVNNNDIVSPDTIVFTTYIDFSSSTAAGVATPRIDGVNFTGTMINSSVDNTSTFGNYPLYLGSRASGSFPWQGNFYGLIIRQGLLSSSDLLNTENWIADKADVILRLLTATSTSYSITGTDASLEKGYGISAASESYILTGTDITFSHTYIFSTEGTSYTLTGANTNLNKSKTLSLQTVSFTLLGQDTSLEKGYEVSAESGSFIETGTDATLIYTPIGYTLELDSSTYTETGTDATLIKTGIHFVGSATGTTTATLPPHQAGDLILIAVFNNTGGSAPGIPTDTQRYTLRTSSSSTGARWLGLYYKIAQSSSETIGDWATATDVLVGIYRNTFLEVNPWATVLNNTNLLDYTQRLDGLSTIDFSVRDGTSWAVGIGAIKTADADLITPPTGMVYRDDSNNRLVLHDTGEGRVTWNDTTVDLTENNYGYAFVLNLVAYPPGTTYLLSDFVDIGTEYPEWGGWFGEDASWQTPDSYIGIRFTDINVPQGANIESAYINLGQITNSEIGTYFGNMWGYNADDAPAFVNPTVTPTTLYPNRTSVSTPVAWQDTHSPYKIDVSAILQEIVNRPGWVSGNNVSFFSDNEGVPPPYNPDYAFIQYRTKTADTPLVTHGTPKLTILSNNSFQIGRYRASDLEATSTSLLHGRNLNLEGTSYTLTGGDIALDITIAISLESGTFIETGSDLSFNRTYALPLEATSYVLTGADATLNAFVMEAGELSLTGTDVSLEKGYSLSLETTSYTQTGTNASLEKGYEVSAESDAYSVTGTDITFDRIYNLSVDTNTIVLVGSDIELLSGDVIPLENGSFISTGTDVGFSKGRGVELDSAEYSSTGTDITFLKTYIYSIGSGSYISTGKRAGLRKHPYRVSQGRNPNAIYDTSNTSGVIYELTSGTNPDEIYEED